MHLLLIRHAEPVRIAPGEAGAHADPHLTRRGHEQAARLAKLRAERDQGAVDAALAELRKAAESDAGTANVLYPMKDALRARATVGEVCNALREVWGAYVPTDAF